MDRNDITALQQWFRVHQRDLPWRRVRTPYAVWISEVMLQQTQVATVVPYFERWMERLPTVKALAEAPLERVMKLWEGLGYYSRARHLHEGARMLVESFGGDLPSDPLLLKSVKGIGPYTLGAIRSFAFHQRAAALDTNGMRVLARYRALDKPLAAIHKALWSYAESILPEREPWLFNEALIELGATLCHKVPRCGECPLQKGCQACAKGLQREIPQKKMARKLTTLLRHLFLLMHGERLLVRQVEQGEVMAGLWEFPFLESDSMVLSQEALLAHLSGRFPCPLLYRGALDEVRHSFTRYRVRLFPYLIEVKDVTGDFSPYVWREGRALREEVSLSAGHRKVLEEL